MAKCLLFSLPSWTFDNDYQLTQPDIELRASIREGKTLDQPELPLVYFVIARNAC